MIRYSKMNNIEFQNETEESYNVAVCRSTVSGDLYVHLLGKREKIHDKKATTVAGEDYEIVEISERKL